MGWVVIEGFGYTLRLVDRRTYRALDVSSCATVRGNGPVCCHLHERCFVN